MIRIRFVLVVVESSILFFEIMHILIIDSAFLNVNSDISKIIDMKIVTIMVLFDLSSLQQIKTPL